MAKYGCNRLLCLNKPMEREQAVECGGLDMFDLLSGTIRRYNITVVGVVLLDKVSHCRNGP